MSKIDFSTLHNDFQPKNDLEARWPSREARSEPPAQENWQISVRGPRHILQRFKQMAEEDRRSYHDMLEILMNTFDQSRKL